MVAETEIVQIKVIRYDLKSTVCVISLPHERFGTTWAFDQIGFDLVELPQVVTWPQSSKEKPSRK